MRVGQGRHYLTRACGAGKTVGGAGKGFNGIVIADIVVARLAPAESEFQVIDGSYINTSYIEGFDRLPVCCYECLSPIR